MNQKALSLDQYGQKWGEIINYRTKAIINANETNPDWKCIDSNINKSISLAEKKGALPDLVTCYFRYSELLSQKGDNEKSEFYREKRQALAEQIGIRI